MPVKAALVKWLPWSVFKTFRAPYFASAYSRAAKQNETSIVFDSRRAGTARLAQWAARRESRSRCAME
ncbi:hypothetical protein IVB25_26210 [Bradyrhizobium sp. 193]|uniref:hypothetical protein n=1 Tax=Bradyrhizobium sp. 193 TaxID=2782661 RepID=UPI001FFBF079|nr:hypothetical protein [Bradyrhizobium sp. 193]MCK1486087.1 hypothetical protein [Bradyrhizobium sp. 193]